MFKRIQQFCANLPKKIRRSLMKTSLEQWLSFGVKSDMPQKQIMVVYAGYSLLGTLLLALPIASNGDVPFVDHLFTVVFLRPDFPPLM